MTSRAYLTDLQIADVFNFIKNSRGNKIPGNIPPVLVAAERNK